MRTALTTSFALHAVAIVVAYYGFPQLFQTPELIDNPIVVELVTIAEKTHAVKAVPKEKPKERPQEKPKEKPKAPPKVKPEHRPKAEPKAPPPPPPVKVAAVQPEPAPPPKPKKKPELKKPEPKKQVKTAPKPRWKPMPPPKPEKVEVKKPPPKKKFDPTRIAALLDKTRKKETPVEMKVAAKQPLPKSVAVISRSASRTSSAPMTISEVDAVRYKIEKCWIVPAGARDAENLIVQIRILLNQDGTIRGAPEIVNQSRMNQAGQQFFKIAAESARRAVLKCQPYDMLPPKKYERWQEIELTFNPKEMLGG